MTDRPLTAWDRRVDRLLHSRNAVERRHLYLGKSRDFGYPVLLDRDLLNLHGWVHGGSGSRKTSLSFASLITQLILGENPARRDWLARRGHDPGEPCSVVVIDLKGDQSLLWNCQLEARRAGLPFRLFTNVVGRPSHVFNPLAPHHLAPLVTTNQKCQTVLQALSAEYGPGYGPSFFSAMNEIVLLEYLWAYGLGGSFADLHALLADPALFPGAKADWAKAQHLPPLARRLAGVYPLNLTPADLPGRPEVFANELRLPDLLKQSQVAYFFLQTAVEKTTVSAVAKLALYLLFAAAASRGPADDRRVYVSVDEFQQVVSANMATLLEQARSMRLSLVLAHQNIGQLRADRGAELVDAVESSVGFEQAFKLAGVDELERARLLSGEKRDYVRGWRDTVQHEQTSRSGEGWSVTTTRPVLLTEEQVTETRVPRLGTNDLIEISAAPMQSLVRFSEGSGYTQYSGYFVPLVGEFHIDQDEYRLRSEAGWPDDLGPGTVTVEGDEAVRDLAERAKRRLDRARFEAAGP